MQYSFFQFLLSFVLRSTQYLGPWTEATHLAIFLTLSLIVPLTSYDILRRARGRWSGVAGGVVVAVALPQIIWAHHSWSEGTDIILIMLALWAVSLALDPDYPRPGRAFVLAGITMGMLGLMRPPMLLLALIFGLVILLTPHLRRRWLRWGMALGIPFVLIVGGWTLFIHYPSTHKLSPAPYTGWNLLLSAMIKGLPIEAGNGPATAELIRLGAVHTPLDDEPLSVEEFFTMIGNPAISGTPENYTWYLAQPPAPEADLTRLNDFPIFEWLYYLGIDRADQLMKTAFQETLQGRQGYYVLGIFIDMFRMYDPGWNGMFKNWYPEENSMTWGQRGPLGWQRATQDTLAIINLQDTWLWRPGVRFLSIITPLLRNIPSWFTYLVLGWTLLLSHVWPTGPSQNWQRRQPILWAGLVLISDITWAATTLPGFRRHVLTDAVWVLCLVWMCADISSVRYITQERRINQKSPARSEKVE